MRPAHSDARTLPHLGVGLGYRPALQDAIFDARDSLDFLELLTDNFLDGPRGLREVEEIRDRFPIVLHGTGLSIGSAIGIDREYLASVKRISDITGSPFYSEHLCVTRAPGLDIGHLSPLHFTEDALDRTIRNVLLVQEVLEKPLALENVTYLVELPGATMTQPEFFRRVVESTGCGVLLDVTNVYINAANHGFDPEEFLASMPLDAVLHVHLAGGYRLAGTVIDSHSEPVEEESWTLLESLARRTRVPACVIERDEKLPVSVLPLLAEVGRARATIGRHAALHQAPAVP